MKHVKALAAWTVIVAFLCLASQVSAQNESGTVNKPQTTEKKTDPNTGKTSPPLQSSKERPGGKAPGVTQSTQTTSGTTTGASTSTVTSSKSGGMQKVNMYDATGNLIYYYDQLGYVRNPKNRVFFQYTASGQIIKKRTVVGTVTNGVIKDRTGKEYGHVEPDGKIIDARNKLAGTVKSDGTILDKSGAKIGSAPGVDKHVAAMVYFYQSILENTSAKNAGSK